MTKAIKVTYSAEQFVQVADCSKVYSEAYVKAHPKDEYGYEDFVKRYETVPKNYPDDEPWTYKFDRTEWLFDEMVKEREK